jgi:hypothetical protein
MEHRCGTRYPTDIGVYISARTGTLSSPGRLCDVSVSGALIATAMPIEPLNFIILQLPAVYSIPKLQAQVIRCTAEGIAVEWQDYVPELVQQVLHRQAVANQIVPRAQALDLVQKVASALVVGT